MVGGVVNPVGGARDFGLTIGLSLNLMSVGAIPRAIPREPRLILAPKHLASLLGLSVHAIRKRNCLTEQTIMALVLWMLPS